MATLTKIFDVQLLVGFTTEAAVADCFQIEQILNDNAIPHLLLNYQQESVYPSIFENLSTWMYDTSQYQITDFPILLWKEEYDTGEQVDAAVFNSTDLMSRNVIIHKDLVQ